MKTKFVVRTLVIFCATFSLLFFYERNTYQKNYYTHALKKPVRPLLIKALALFDVPSPKPYLAIDLGFGAGNETAYLLQQGFKVVAVDNNLTAIRTLVERSDVQPYVTNLQINLSSFEALTWRSLPKADLIVALYSLPFCDRRDFHTIFDRIKKLIKDNGYFVGNFFGPDFSSFKKRVHSNITFLTKDEVLELLKPLEVQYFKENIQPAFYCKGDEKVKVIEHTYDIIARKNTARAISPIPIKE